MNNNTFTILFLTGSILAAIFGFGILLCDTHDEADLIITDYAPDGYYFEDYNGRGYNWTIHQDDTSWYIQNKNPNEFIKEIQALEYIEDTYDGEKGEFFFTFNETIMNGGGDCEDVSLVIAKGLHDMGFNTCIFITEEHVFVGIDVKQVNSNYLGIHKKIYTQFPSGDNQANGYYFLEATGNWNIGEYDGENEKIEKIYFL